MIMIIIMMIIVMMVSIAITLDNVVSKVIMMIMVNTRIILMMMRMTLDTSTRQWSWGQSGFRWWWSSLSGESYLTQQSEVQGSENLADHLHKSVTGWMIIVMIMIMMIMMLIMMKIMIMMILIMMLIMMMIMMMITSTSPSQGELTPAFVFQGRAPPL